MSTVITTLTENTAGTGWLLAEWGLSILIKTEETSILLDSGPGISAAHNAETLGVDLGRVSHIVLSHGHMDHTGGLRDILHMMKKEVEIVAHPAVWDAKYAGRRGGKKRYVGIPFQRNDMEDAGARFNLTTKPVKLAEGITSTGEIPVTNDFEPIEPDRFFVKEGNGFQPDTLPDDQAVIVQTPEGLVVALGCGHRGLINTLTHARQITGEKRIYMVLGGCHLVGASEERVHLTIAALKEMDVQRIGVSHCTSLPVAASMACELGERFFFNNAGTRIEVG